MFLLLLYSTSSYQNVYKKKKFNDYFLIPESYYFQKGGKYSFQFNNAKGDFFILLGTNADINKFTEIYKVIQENKDYSKSLIEINQSFNFYKTFVLKTVNGYGNFSGSIDKDILLRTLIASCNFSKLTFTLTLTYSNPMTKLSLHVQKCIKTFPIFIICISIIFILWLILWFYNFSYTNVFHFLFTIFFVLNIIDKVSLYHILLIHNFSDVKTTFYNLYPKIYSIKVILLFNIVLISDCLFMLPDFQFNYLILITSVISIITVFSYYDIFHDDFSILLVFSISLLPLINAFCIFIPWENDMLHSINSFLMYCYFILTILFEYEFEFSPFSNIYFINLIYNVFEVALFIFILFVSHFEKEKWHKYYQFESYILSKIENDDESAIYIDSFVTKIKSNDYQGVSVTSVTFDENSQLKIIENNAFKFKEIKSITIPSSVIQIGSFAFASCNYLQNVDFIEISKIKVLESYIFSDSSIESLYIPSSIINLNNFWCKNTKKLTKVSISQNNLYLTNFDNNNLIVGKNNRSNNDFDILYFAPRNIKTVTIPHFIKQIASCAFEYCQNLKTIDFSNNTNLKTIGKYSFAYSSIEKISIPSTVNLFDDYSFYYCRKIKTVIMKNDSDLKIIGKNAFYNCSSLKSFVVPSHVIRIEENAFSECSKLKTFEIKENSELISFDKNIFNGSPNIVLFAPFKITDFH